MKGWRRRLVAFLVVAAVVMLFGQGLAWWLARPHSQRRLAQWLSRQLEGKLGVPCQVGVVQLRLYPLQLTLLDVTLGPRSSPWLKAARAQVSLGALKLSSRQLQLSYVSFRGLELSSRALELGGQGSRGQGGFAVSVRQLEVREASLDGLALAPDLTLHLGNVELVGAARAGMATLWSRVGSVRLARKGTPSVEARVAFWGSLLAGEFQIRRLALAGGGLAADLKGQVRWQEQLELDLSGRVVGELAQVDRFFSLGLGLTGTARAEGELRVAHGSWSVDARVLSERVEVVGFPVEKVKGSIHLSPEGIEASLEEGLFAGGQVEGSYRLADFGPTFAHRIAVRGDGLELETFLALLGIPPAGLASEARVSAELAFDGQAIGQGQGLAVVHLTPAGKGLGVEGQLLIALQGDGALRFQGRSLQLAGGSVHWQGRLSLGTWRPQWSLASEGVPVEAVAKLLAGWVGTPILPAELSGTAVFDLQLAGSFDDPVLMGTVALSPVCFGPMEADGLEGEISFARGVFQVTEGRLVLGKGQADFSAQLRLGEASPQVELRFASRALPLARMASWGGLRFPLQGTAAVHGHLRGSMEEPRLAARMSLSHVQVVGLGLGDGGAALESAEGVLRIRDLQLGSLAGELTVDFPRRYAEVHARLRSLGLEPLSPPLAQLLGGNLEAQLDGQFPWEAPAGRLSLQTAQGARGTILLDQGGLRAQLARQGHWRLSAELRQGQRAISGQAQLTIESVAQLLQDVLGQDAGVDGSVSAALQVTIPSGGEPQLVGEVNEAVLRAEGQEVRLRAPARLRLQGGEVELVGLDMEGDTAQLQLQASRRRDGEVRGIMSGVVPASLLGLVWREAAPRGRVEVLAELSGWDRAPRVEGELRVAEGALQVPGLPSPLTAIEGVVQLVGEVLTMRDVRFAFRGGSGLCSGQIRFWPRVELDLDLRLWAIRWPLAVGFEPSLDGQVRLSGDLAALQLAGNVTLRRSLYQRDVNLQRLVLEELTSPERLVPKAKGLVAFDVHIQVPGTFEVRTPMARLAAQGELRLLGHSGQPGVLGRLEALPGGELELSGVAYEVERASVTFTDPNGLRPILDLQARGLVQNFAVSLGLSGTLDRLVPSLSSDPPLPEADILALIALGVSPASVGATASTSTMASSFLAEQLAGAVTQRTRNLLALDQLRIDPVLTAETGPPTARVTMVKQLSPDWSVTVSTNLSSNREEVLVSRWRVGKDVYVEATRDSDGSYSLEVRWRRRY